MNKRYQSGYLFAKQAIERKDSSPQKLYDQSYGALDQDDFDKGWQDACIEMGAITEN